MKNIISVLLAFIMVFSTIMPVHSEEEKEMKISAKSVILIEQTTGTVLYEQEANVQRPPASTTKIMTALIALEKGSLDAEFVVSTTSAAVDGSQIGLLAGDKITLKDLLHMLLLKSANDAAETIAENIAGSNAEFAKLMNDRAAEIGCKNTNFMNPHGLPDDNHLTTAYDLALIAREAMKNEEFCKIVKKETAILDYHKIAIANSNKLLKMDENFNGIKTGFTKKAGRCLVSSATNDNATLICVTLDASDDWNDHKTLMGYGFTRVATTVIMNEGEYSASRNVLNGNKSACLLNSTPLYGIEIDGKPVEYEYQQNIVPVLFAPLQANKICGEVCLKYNGQIVSKSTLYNSELVLEKETELGPWQIFKNNLKRLLCFL